MKNFNIYAKKDESGNIVDIVAITNSIRFWAFIFGVIWLVYKKEYKYAIALFALHFLISLLSQSILLGSVLHIIINLYLLFNGSDILENHINNDNYKQINIVSADSLDEAKLKIFSQYHKMLYIK